MIKQSWYVTQPHEAWRKTNDLITVSPSRSESFRGLISDWRDDPITDATLALLPEWVRWNGEQAGVPAALIERAVSAASAS